MLFENKFCSNKLCLEVDAGKTSLTGALSTQKRYNTRHGTFRNTVGGPCAGSLASSFFVILALYK